MSSLNIMQSTTSIQTQDPMERVLDEFKGFFNLNEMPFLLLPNTSFYVDLPSHQQCFSTLMFAVASGEGIIKIIGEVGTGKTLLCRRLLNSLNEDKYYSAYIPNPNLNPTELKRALARELQVPDLEWLGDDEIMENAGAYGGGGAVGGTHQLNVFVLVRLLFHYLEKVDPQLLLVGSIAEGTRLFPASELDLPITYQGLKAFSVAAFFHEIRL